MIEVTSYTTDYLSRELSRQAYLNWLRQCETDREKVILKKLSKKIIELTNQD